MGEEDEREMSDASPPPPWEHGVVEQFDATLLGDEVYIVDDEEMSDVEMSEGSPVPPSEASTLPSPPLRKCLAPVVPSDVPEEVVRAVDAVIMGGGVGRLREMVSKENGEVSHFIVDVMMLTIAGWRQRRGRVHGRGVGSRFNDVHDPDDFGLMIFNE